MLMNAYHLQGIGRSFLQGGRRTHQPHPEPALLLTKAQDKDVDVVAYGLQYGLVPDEVCQLLILFGHRASKHELLSNMRRPSRIR